jgi:hypothetical protein
MGILSALINEVEGAIDNVMKQVEESVGVEDAIKSALNPIVGGAWVGQGADAFIQVVNQELIAALRDLILSISALGQLIKDALDFIKEVDEMLSNPIGVVESVFDAIF